MGMEVDEACEKCKHKCLLIHGKNRKHTALPIISFFKIMIGDKSSKFLYLPPKFGRTVSDLVGQKIHLEDSNGQQWGVTVSKLNDSIVFKQGWDAFSFDHGLKFGEFVMFHYVTGSHFVVQIFDKTGCEKLDFPEEEGYPNKRSRTDDNCISKDCACHTSDKSSMNKQGSSTSWGSKSDIEMNQSQCDVNNVDNIPMASKNTSNCVNSNGRSLPELKTDMEESYFMINRDLPCKQEDRSSIFDLSMHCNSSAANRIIGHLAGNERFSLQDMFPESQTKAGSVGKDPVAVEVPSWERPSNASQFQTNDDFSAMPKISSKCDNDSCNRVTTEIVLTKSAAKPGENKDCPDMSNKVINRGRIAERKKNTSTGERLMAIKQEHVEMTPGHCSRKGMIQGKEPNVMKEAQGQSLITIKDGHKAYKVVKAEPSDMVFSPSPIATRMSCLVATNNQSYLELPACLPLVSFKGRTRADGKVVFLLDPVMRFWPVLYYERYSNNVLMSGWEAFSTANSIQQGDECLFEVESIPEGIYKVCIIRRF